MKLNICNKVLINSIAITLLIAFNLSTPTQVIADGQDPKEIKKTPFDPSQKLKSLNSDLRICITKVKEMELQLASLNKTIKIDTQQLNRARKNEKDIKAARDNQAALAKKDTKLLKKGVDAKGKPLSTEGRAKLQNRQILTSREAKRLDGKYKQSRKDTKVADRRLRTTKSEHKKLRSKHFRQINKCDEIRRKIAAAKKI
ncbi:hypothetical protein [Amylibacter sp. IMCC11727]|uniref:hypothetical protein n=1 Tax=Amylibacter sp. IMCC11727 TaxID=3039851 RepID=UPI00244DBE82|nr:hypothetical protein [Amylibacter sp. IMCC11727]WGI20566.1 hypothetical protein QBD29_10600 [Amylibacter sp. IMCC11727]